MKRIFFLVLYYSFARHIPTFPLFLQKYDWGGYLRKVCAKHIFKSCGKKIYVGHKAYFGSGKNIELGDYSAIGINCHVPNDIKIGKYVMMGPDCYFLNSNGSHVYNDIHTPMMFQGKKHDPQIVVGDDVWFGRQCLVLSGKRLGSHSIIAAGSVVCKDVEDYSIVGGNPIKLIKKRN